MMVKAVLNLYTSDPKSGQFMAWVEQLKQHGVLVFLHPLTKLKHREKSDLN